MDFYKLKQFVTVCDCNSVTKAADILFTTQPSLSRSITNIEKQLNCTFFIRRGNILTLNEKGKQFYTFASETLERYDEFLKHLEHMEKEDGAINCCFNHAVFAQYIRGIFLQQQSDIKLHTRFLKKESIDKALIDGLYDVALTDFLSQNSLVTSLPIFRCILYASLPKGHKLENLNSITLEDLDGENLIHQYDENLGGINAFIDVLKKRAPNCKHVQTVDQYSLFTFYDKFEDIYFVNSFQTVNYSVPNRTLKPLDYPPPKYYYACYSNKNRMKEFEKVLYNYFNTAGE